MIIVLGLVVVALGLVGLYLLTQRPTTKPPRDRVSDAWLDEHHGGKER